MKTISRPVLSINGTDLWTGKYNAEEVTKNEKRFDDMMEKQKAKANDFIKNAPRNELWQIYVQWLGRVY